MCVFMCLHREIRTLQNDLSTSAKLVIKNPPANAGDLRDTGSIPGLGRSPTGGRGNPLQYSCLENPIGERTLLAYNP